MIDEYVLRATADVGNLVKGANEAEQAIDRVHEAGDKLGEKIFQALQKPGDVLPQLGEKLNDFYNTISKTPKVESPISGASASTSELTSTLSAQQQLLADQKARLEELKRVYEILYNTMGTVPREFGTLTEYRQHLVDIMNAADGSAASLRRAEDAAMKLDRVDDAMLALGDGNLDLATRFGFKQVGEDLKNMEREVSMTEERLQAMAAAGQEAAQATAAANAAGGGGGFLAGLGAMASGAVSHLGSLANAALNAGQAVGGVLVSGLRAGVSLLGRAGSAASGFVKNLFSIRPGAKAAEGGVKGLVKGLTSFSRLLITRFKRSIISGIFNGIKEGMGSLAQESAGVNSAISGMISSFKQLTNQLIAFLGPLIQVAGPIVSQVIQGLTRAAESASAFTAALTGASTYKSALAVPYDYAAKSAEKATKSAKKYQATVLGFDQINRLGSNDSSAESSGPKFQDAKIPDGIKGLGSSLRELLNGGEFKGIGSKLAELANGAVSWLKSLISWENVGDKIKKILGAIIDAFNTFVKEFDWTNLGALVGEGINTLINSLQILLSGIDFRALGEAFAKGLNGLISTVDWNGLGELLMTGLMDLVDLVASFAETLDWGAVGEAIHKLLAGAIEKYDPEKVGKAVGTLINGLFKALKTAIDPKQWAEIGSKLAETVNSAVAAIKPEDMAAGLENFAKALLDGLLGFIYSLDTNKIAKTLEEVAARIDWKGVISKCFELAGAVIGSIMGVISTFVMDLFAAVIQVMLGAPDKFKEQVEACGGDIGKAIWTGITGALGGLIGWFKENIFTPITEGFKKAFDKGYSEPKIQVRTGDGTAVIQGFAGGGFPSTGQVFMARERGPEMVGTIGSQAAVANNGQIVEAVSAGVKAAVTEAMLMTGGSGSSEGEGGGDVILYVDSEELARASLKGQRRLDKRSNPVIAFA